MKRKVCVVVTARPSYARIKTALTAIKNHRGLELQLVIGASGLLERYGKVIDIIRKDGFEIAAEVHMVIEGETPATSAKTAGLGIVEMSSVFNALKPDAVLSIADRYETIATAIAASFMNIPVVHVQGGEVTGSIDEKVRHAVTKLSDIHLVSNISAYERVVKLGEDPAHIHVTGCPSIDLAAETKRHVQDQDLQESLDNQLSKGVGAAIDRSKDYVICMLHPVTYEWEMAGDQTRKVLDAIHSIEVPCYWFWPNIDAGADQVSKTIRIFREHVQDHKIHFLKNMPPEEFLTLLSGSKCIIGNSSVGIRESAYLGVPSVNIGSRQNGRDRGANVIDTTHDSQDIRDAVAKQLGRGKYDQDLVYGDGTAGKRIADILASTELLTEKRLTY